MWQSDEWVMMSWCGLNKHGGHGAIYSVVIWHLSVVKSII